MPKNPLETLEQTQNESVVRATPEAMEHSPVPARAEAADPEAVEAVRERLAENAAGTEASSLEKGTEAHDSKQERLQKNTETAKFLVKIGNKAGAPLHIYASYTPQEAYEYVTRMKKAKDIEVRRIAIGFTGMAGATGALAGFMAGGPAVAGSLSVVGLSFGAIGYAAVRGYQFLENTGLRAGARKRGLST